MRTEIERRPALIALAGLAIGLTAPVFLANLVFLAVGVVGLRGLRPRIFLAVAFLIGAVLSPPFPNQGLVTQRAVDGSFDVISCPTRINPTTVAFIARSGADEFEVLTDEASPSLGDTVLVQGTAKPLPQERERTYLSRGITGVVAGLDARVSILKRSNGPVAWGTAWRESFLSYCSQKLSPKDGGAAAAIAFDVRTGLSTETRQSLEQSGTVHVLAASGLQLLVLGWFLELVLSRAFIGMLVRRTCILGLLTVYAGAAGFHPGVFRALVATGLRNGAIVVGREFDGLAALGVAGVSYLLWQPREVYDAGFQLSMVIGAGIVAFRSASDGANPVARVARGALVAWLCSVPIVAHLFGIVSLTSIPANFIAAALLPICLIGVLAAHAVSFLSPGFGDVLVAPAAVAAQGIQEIVRFFGSGAWWGFHVPEFSGYWLPAVYGAGLALWKPRVRPAA